MYASLSELIYFVPDRDGGRRGKRKRDAGGVARTFYSCIALQGGGVASISWLIRGFGLLVAGGGKG